MWTSGGGRSACQQRSESRHTVGPIHHIEALVLHAARHCPSQPVGAALKIKPLYLCSRVIVACLSPACAPLVEEEKDMALISSFMSGHQ